MKRMAVLLAVAMLLAAGCASPGQVKKKTAPGQVQKHTGYNPASGKVKTR